MAELIVRLLVTFVFWSSALGRLANLSEDQRSMIALGLKPAALFSVGTIVLLLVASILIVLDRWTWLAAAFLAVFTLLTIPIGHPFWSKTGPEAFHDFTIAMEHISLIGGLGCLLLLSTDRRLPER